jgi:hypothetical protein
VTNELSRQRAKVALALLEGDRGSFKSLSNGRHKRRHQSESMFSLSNPLLQRDPVRTGGAGATNASGSAVPAKIEFVGRFTPAVRTRPTPDERPSVS